MKTKATGLFLKSAEAGFSPAQYNIGVRYAYGRGVAKDESKSFHWFEACAKQEEVGCELGVAAGLANGLGVPKDSTAALGWYLRAADADSADGQLQAGVMLLGGEGVPPNPKRALELLTAAANQESLEAIVHLGTMYTDGKNFPIDRAEALKWFWVLKLAGHDEVMPAVDSQAKFLTTAQIATAKQQAQKFLDALKSANHK